MNPAKHPARNKVHAALKTLGKGTQTDISGETGMSLDAIRNVLSRGAAAGYFRKVGEIPGRGMPKTVWAACDPKRASPKLAPIVGAQQVRDYMQTLTDNGLSEYDTEDVGRYDVRYENEYGFVIIVPCYSMSWAQIVQNHRGGEIVAA